LELPLIVYAGWTLNSLYHPSIMDQLQYFIFHFLLFAYRLGNLDFKSLANLKLLWAVFLFQYQSLFRILILYVKHFYYKKNIPSNTL